METDRSPVEVLDVDARIAEMEAQFDTPAADVSTPAFQVEDFQTSSFLKDISGLMDSAPVHANQVANSVLLDRLDRDMLRDAPERELGSAALATTVESAPAVEKAKGTPEKASEKTRRSLGARALGSLRDFGKKFQETYYAGVATAVATFPRTKTRQELIELNDQQQEKYADKPTDGFFTRRWNNIRRNKYNLYSWAPAGAMGLAAFELFAMRAAGYASVTEHYDIMPLVTSRPIDLIMGGHTQGDAVGSGYEASLVQAGIIDPKVDDVRPVDWSAQMAPVSGDQMPMTMSDQEGAARLMDAINNANGAPVRIISFSQGTEATLRALNTVAAQNGGTVPDNITVILQGTPSGDLGLGKNPLVHTVDPLLSAAGIETTQPIPPGAHVIVRTDIADVFGNGGNQSALKLGEMAVGPGHQVDGPGNGIMLYTYQKDGVTYEVWGNPQGVDDPLLRYAQANGLPVSPEAEAFMSKLVPYTPPGSPGPVYANANDVASSFGAMTDRAISDNTGGAPSDYASRATAAVMSDPTTRNDLQTALNLERLPDQLNDAIQNPQNAPADLQNVNSEVTNAANTAMSYVQNPNKLVDAVNRGLAANGVPPLVPHVEQLQQAANQMAAAQRQVYIPPVHNTVAPAHPVINGLLNVRRR